MHVVVFLPVCSCMISGGHSQLLALAGSCMMRKQMAARTSRSVLPRRAMPLCTMLLLSLVLSIAQTYGGKDSTRPVSLPASVTTDVSARIDRSLPESPVECNQKVTIFVGNPLNFSVEQPSGTAGEQCGDTIPTACETLGAAFRQLETNASKTHCRHIVLSLVGNPESGCIFRTFEAPKYVHWHLLNALTLTIAPAENCGCEVIHLHYRVSVFPFDLADVNFSVYLDIRQIEFELVSMLSSMPAVDIVGGRTKEKLAMSVVNCSFNNKAASITYLDFSLSVVQCTFMDNSDWFQADAILHFNRYESAYVTLQQSNFSRINRQAVRSIGKKTTLAVSRCEFISYFYNVFDISGNSKITLTDTTMTLAPHRHRPQLMYAIDVFGQFNIAIQNTVFQTTSDLIADLDRAGVIRGQMMNDSQLQVRNATFSGKAVPFHFYRGMMWPGTIVISHFSDVIISSTPYGIPPTLIQASGAQVVFDSGPFDLKG